MKKILTATVMVFFLITIIHTRASASSVPTDGVSFVQSLYSCILGRESSASEVDGWLNTARANGMGIESSYRSFFFSEEYQAKRTNDEAYIGALYRCMFYRNPDTEGVMEWVRHLSLGAQSRLQILSLFIDSDEFVASVLPELQSATGRNAREANDKAPIGQYVGAPSQGGSFTSAEKILMTPFFFWSNAVTGEAMTNQGVDRLTHHPVSLTNPPFSFASKEWWAKEMTDVVSAGIDVILPVYWGFPDPTGRSNDWSYGGITTMVQALREMDALGRPHPKIGMFYDTSTLGWNPLNRRLDLRTETDRDYFYRTIRDYFSMIPPKYRAMIDGKPVVVLYEPAFAAGYDQGAFEYVYAHFEQDFGVRPYIIVNNNWNGVTVDNTTRWGAAISGPFINGVAQIGPGYDQSALVNTGERTPLSTDRRGGDFYRGSWDIAIRSGKLIIIIETWNEFNEGSDIAHSREFGRLYLDITRQYAERWKATGSFSIPASRDAFAQYLGSCVLGRAVTSGEISAFQQVPASTRLGQIYAWVFGSSEYVNKMATNDTFVAQVYRCVLFRNADINEVSYWASLLSGSLSREGLLSRFIGSPEVQNEFQSGQGRRLQATTGFAL